MSGTDLPSAPAQPVEEASRKSTPPPSKYMSVTPPISWPISHPLHQRAPSHSPTNSQLTSPPPTTYAPALQVAARRLSVPVHDEDVEDMTTEELRMLVAGLRLELREARTMPAHFQLQYKMLQMDSAERENRLTVELEMAQREIEALISAEERRNQAMMSPTSAVAEATTANATLLNDLQRQLTILTQENEQLRDVVVSQKKDIEHRDGIIVSFEEEVERLRGRIRKNREHVNGLLDNIYESNGSPRSWMGTPVRSSAHQTPRHMPQRQILPTSTPRGSQPFEALLLADKVLSQETAPGPPTTPRTQPHPRRGTQAAHHHTRGVHSLSSIPTTPQRRPQQQQASSSRALQTPPHLSAILEPAHLAPYQTPHHQQPPPPKPIFSLATGPGARRRASSDSTISASSGDPAASAAALATTPRKRKGRVATPGVEDAIPESQASQAATSMLRLTPVSKGGSGSVGAMLGAGPQQQQQQPQVGKLMAQARLAGRVTKPGVKTPEEKEKEKEKRRLVSQSGGGVQASPSKRSRVDHAGLGIVLAGSPR